MSEITHQANDAHPSESTLAVTVDGCISVFRGTVSRLMWNALRSAQEGGIRTSWRRKEPALVRADHDGPRVMHIAFVMLILVLPAAVGCGGNYGRSSTDWASYIVENSGSVEANDAEMTIDARSIRAGVLPPGVGKSFSMQVLERSDSATVSWGRLNGARFVGTVAVPTNRYAVLEEHYVLLINDSNLLALELRLPGKSSDQTILRIPGEVVALAGSPPEE